MKKLTRVKLINWHRFTNEIIDFEKSTLISGENGAGKSTLLDAVQFVITCSTKYFNKAAHENGKRELTGYIRCKTGKENQPYERNGEISAHVALEFYEEKKQKYFIVGAVIDSATEGQEKTIRYLMDGERLDDSLFFQEKTPKSISVFRTTNSKKIKQLCTTDKEAKGMMKNRFGRIEDKFFKLIPKALAFRPIDDIKDFVYSYVLDEKAVNIDILRENVRTYQDLQQTLENIKIRMSKLENIKACFTQVENGKSKDLMYEYFIERANADILSESIKELEKELTDTEYRLKLNEGKVTEINKKHKQTQNMRDQLMTELASDKDFIARDEQKKKLEELEELQKELKAAKADLILSINKAKAEVNQLLKVPDVDDCVRVYAFQLENLEKSTNTEPLADSLSDVIRYKQTMLSRVLMRLATLNTEIAGLKQEQEEWNFKIENLNKKKMFYPKEVSVVENAIKEEFLQIGRKPEPRILCELLEIEDGKWRDAVEGYLNTQRFYILVEPGSFDIALGTYERLRKEKKAAGVGLINTQKLESYDEAPEGSLATVVSSKNKYAKRYINMVLGKVMMCEHYSQLKNYKTAITKECMKYQNHVASAIRPSIFEIPYIGKEAIRVQLEYAQKERDSLKNKIQEKKEVFSRLEELQRPLSTETDVDIKYKMHVILDIRNNELEIKQCKANIATLDKNSGMIMKKIQLDELEKMITEINEEIAELNKRCGQYEKAIENLKLNLVEKNNAYVGQKNLFLELGAKREEHLTAWNNEYDKQTKEKSFEQFRINYSARRKANQTTTDRSVEEMVRYMSAYKEAHGFGAPATLDGYQEFELEYIKLKDSELLTYEEKVESARQSAESEFREQFLSKLQENMKNAQNEFKELNKALRDIAFSNEKYEFMYMPSKHYRHYYEMIMDDFNAMQGESIFTGLFHQNHKEVIDELFEKLALDNDKSGKVLDEFTDYRTYMDYDIKIVHSDGSYSLYSKVCEEKSGGETQTPFYVTVAASFVQLYKNGIGGESIGLVLFDEAFNNMDDERIGGVLEFLQRLPLQIVIAAPPDKIQYISPFVEETLLVMTDERVSYTERYYNGSL